MEDIKSILFALANVLLAWIGDRHTSVEVHRRPSASHGSFVIRISQISSGTF